MERSQNWPDLRSPISKFWDIHFIDSLACSNRWKFQGNRSIGVALRKIQTVYEVRSLDVTWWPDLAWPGSEICTTCAEKMYDKVCQKRRRCAPPFLSYSRKTSWGGVQTPPPAGRGLTAYISLVKFQKTVVQCLPYVRYFRRLSVKKKKMSKRTAICANIFRDMPNIYQSILSINLLLIWYL